eukprot:gene8071-26226_t
MLNASDVEARTSQCSPIERVVSTTVTPSTDARQRHIEKMFSTFEALAAAGPFENGMSEVARAGESGDAWAASADLDARQRHVEKMFSTFQALAAAGPFENGRDEVMLELFEKTETNAANIEMLQAALAQSQAALAEKCNRMEVKVADKAEEVLEVVDSHQAKITALEDKFDVIFQSMVELRAELASEKLASARAKEAAAAAHAVTQFAAQFAAQMSTQANEFGKK